MVVVAIISVLLTSAYRDRKTDSAPATQPIAQEAEAGSARLFGQIDKLESGKDGRIGAAVQLLENVTGQDNLEEAHLIDGSCTLDQIEQNKCLNSMFYLHPTGKSVMLPIAPDAEIRVYARVSGGGMSVDSQGSVYLETITSAAFVSGYKDSSARPMDTSYRVTTKNGVIVRLEEVLTP